LSSKRVSFRMIREMRRDNGKLFSGAKKGSNSSNIHSIYHFCIPQTSNICSSQYFSPRQTFPPSSYCCSSFGGPTRLGIVTALALLKNYHYLPPVQNPVQTHPQNPKSNKPSRRGITYVQDRVIRQLPIPFILHPDNLTVLIVNLHVDLTFHEDLCS